MTDLEDIARSLKDQYQLSDEHAARAAADYQRAVREYEQRQCRHRRLDEDGICRTCGKDCRGMS